METFFPVDSVFQHHQDHNHRLPFPTNSSAAPCAANAPAHHFQYGNSAALIMRRSMSFSAGIDDMSSSSSMGTHEDQEVGVLRTTITTTHVVGEDDMDDMLMSEDEGGAAPLGEKKKRLNMEQVKALEKSFELGNKLEPERKMQLAGALGLQPRQVAIWFQNRRARWKTKQMEKDYEVLKRQVEHLKADNQLLRAQNNQFHSELVALKTKDQLSGGNGGGGGAVVAGRPINLNTETSITDHHHQGGSWSNGSENSIHDHVNLAATTSSVEAQTGLLIPINSRRPPTINHRISFPNSSTILGQPAHHDHDLLIQGSLDPRINQTTSDEAAAASCNVFINSTTTNHQQQQPAGFSSPSPCSWSWPNHQNFHC